LEIAAHFGENHYETAEQLEQWPVGREKTTNPKRKIMAYWYQVPLFPLFLKTFSSLISNPILHFEDG
jgi:hypothetical protein